MKKTSSYRRSPNFKAYDESNPEIWSAFKKFTFRLIDKGVTHYGAKAIFEAIRYHVTIEHAEDDFKLNNNFTAHYARKFMFLNPEYDGFFEVRGPAKSRNKVTIPVTPGHISTLKQAARIMGQAAHKKKKQSAGQKQFAWDK